jgi:hypothetical protein
MDAADEKGERPDLSEDTAHQISVGTQHAEPPFLPFYLSFFLSFFLVISNLPLRARMPACLSPSYEYHKQASKLMM